MTQHAILPPPPPQEEPEPHSGLRMRPLAERPIADDDGIVDLASWKPAPPSAFPDHWLTPLPPPTPKTSRALRVTAVLSAIAATAGIAVAGTLVYVRMTAEPVVTPMRMVTATDSATATDTDRETVTATDTAPDTDTATDTDTAMAPSPVPAPPPPSAPRRRPPASVVAAPPVEPIAPAVPSEPASPPAVDPALPESPTREQVVGAIEALRPAILECAAGAHGTSTARITVRGNGRVASVIVSGAFAGTPQGSCLARTLRGARLPAFSQETFAVSYPFQL